MARLQRWRGIALLALLAVLPVRAQNEITLNLKDADINTLIATVSEVTGRNFIIDPRVKAKVTVISSVPMSPDSLYETFLAVLQVHGFAALSAGEVIKIVPETNARQDAGESGRRGIPGDEIFTRVLSIENVPAAQLVPILRPLVPQWGHIAAYTPSNMLIISDRAANIARIERIIAEIDRSGDQEIEMVPLKYAAAAEVVRILTTLTQQNKAQEAGSTPASIIADERSNSVLVGGDKSERQKYIEIIKSLDIELPEDGDTQVLYLNYASAENLAPILEGYAEQADQAQAATQGGNASAGGARRAVGSRIIADPDTNALVVTANPKTMRQIRSVVAQLDIQRAQVMVESIIAEVSANKSSELGLDWVIYNPNSVAAAGIYSPTTQSALSNAANAASSGADLEDLAAAGISLLGEGATAFLGKINENGTSFGAILHALQGNGDTNILSAPTLLTMDNEEAEISVGQEVPFLTGSYTNTGSTTSSVNPFQTVERKDVGLTLGVTPQINEGDTVKLKLNLEISSLSAASSSLTQITNKRTISNTVAVQSGQMLVLGGLIDDNVSDSQSGVPFLSNIPLLGSLFKFRSVETSKRNLMVFLRPVILRKRAQADYYTKRKYDSVRSIQLGSGKGAVPLVGGTRPVLKPLEEYLSEDAEVLPVAPLVPEKDDRKTAPGSVDEN